MMSFMLAQKKKQTIIKKHQVHEKDTGSSSVQIATLTGQINELVRHLKKHGKDIHSRRGLLQMVARRRSHMHYLEKKDRKAYEALMKKLSLKLAKPTKAVR